MPVRSLNSPVIRWPNQEIVKSAVEAWARGTRENHPDVVRIGYFGSYARGNWGVGSDIDIVMVVARSDLPWLRRSLGFETVDLPVPADLLVYTSNEWDDVIVADSKFARMIARETVWLPG